VDEDPQSMVQRLIWGTTILSNAPAFQCVSLGSSTTVDHISQGYIELETPCAGSFTGAINELNGSKWWIFIARSATLKSPVSGGVSQNGDPWGPYEK